MWESFLKSFIPLFVALDVLGALPIFARFSGGLDGERRKRVLRDSVLTAFVVTVGFVFVGKTILAYLGILLKDFLIAGGIILFIIAAKELVGGRAELAPHEELFAVVPLGVPLLAGPAVLATSLIVYDSYGVFYLITSLVLNFLICWFVFRYSEYLVRLVGRRWIEAISKVFVLLLASIAIVFVRRGLEGFTLPE